MKYLTTCVRASFIKQTNYKESAKISGFISKTKKFVAMLPKQ